MVTTSRNGNGTISTRRLLTWLTLAFTVSTVAVSWIIRVENHIGAGERFTQEDGNSLDDQITDMRVRVAVLEQATAQIPPPEVRDALVELRRRLDALERTRRP